MLIIRCAGCRAKLFRYKKVGPGQVLRCHKDRIARRFKAVFEKDTMSCPCGQVIGMDCGTFYKMIGSSFTCSGTKDTTL